MRNMILHGSTRLVLLIGPYAIKVPQPFYQWRHFLLGLIANMQERTFGRTGWPELCPVVWSMPGGWVVVMRRARQMTSEEFETFDSLAWCMREGYVIPSEPKIDSFGWLGSRIVAIDYGN